MTISHGCGCATLVCLAALLWAESVGRRAMIYICKPLASCTFIANAVACGALASTYGHGILVAQVLCLIGDILLMFTAQAAFLAGLLCFLAGHGAFVFAFFTGHRAAEFLSPPTLGITLLISGTSLAIHRWLRPHIPPHLRYPVTAYIVIISLMVITATHATLTATAPRIAALGAAMFYASDICVARERFVRPNPLNTTIGLPLYYVAQLLLANSVG